MKNLIKNQILLLLLVLANMVHASSHISLSQDWQYLELKLQAKAPQNSALAKQKIHLAYKIYGDNPELPLMFVAGSSLGISSLQKYDFSSAQGQVLALSQNFRVVVWDARGIGFSSPVPTLIEKLDAGHLIQNYSTREQVQDMESLIQHLNPNNQAFYLMGHSFGSLILYKYLQVFADKKNIAGIYLANPLPMEYDLKLFLKERLKQQIALNHARIPQEMRQKIIKARELLTDINLRSNFMYAGQRLPKENLGFLFSKLDANQIDSIDTVLTKVLKMNLYADREKSLNLLLKLGERFESDISYVLSQNDLFPGLDLFSVYEDVLLENIESIEDWMLLELPAYLQLHKWKLTNPTYYSLYTEAYAKSKKSGLKMDWQKIKKNIQKIPIFYFLSEQDAYIPNSYVEEKIRSQIRPIDQLLISKYHSHASFYRLPFATHMFLDFIDKAKCSDQFN